MKESVRKLQNGIIISCQAYEDTPLYGADYMKKMAESAIMGGANGIRACWPQDIKAIRSITDLPIVGINKVISDKDPLTNVFITPTFESAAEVIEAGADILGIDCTIRESRGFDELCNLLSKIKDRYPEIAIMADLATLNEGVKVAETGLVDIISTTLSGYTLESLGSHKDGPDLDLLKSLKEKVDLPINCEGRIWELSDLKNALDSGADMVTIGTAVTRPHLITNRFVNFNLEYQKHK